MTNSGESRKEISANDAELVNRILPFADTKVSEKGRELIDTGDQSDSFYYVERGSFEVSYIAQETPIVVALIGEGSFFGQIGFFDRITRIRTIKAVEDTAVRVFDHEAMAKIQSHSATLYAQFMEFLLRSVCRRFRQILDDRGPLSVYAASLSTGKEQFQGMQPLPVELVSSSALQQVRGQIEEFKTTMFDIAYRLQKDEGEEIAPELKTKGEAILETFKHNVRRFEEGFINQEHIPLMWGYVFKELFPYFMRSRFAERAYYKPKGYAGDYIMMEQIYRNKAGGDGKLGQLIDGWLLEQVPPQAVRNRRLLLCSYLDKLCRDRLDDDGPIRIMNLACGPARELYDLMEKCDYSDKIDALCIDIDSEALRFAHEHLSSLKCGASIRVMYENVVRWALGRARHELGLQNIIYSSGLCDYLDRKLMGALIRRCYTQLTPGGVLILGNFSHANPDRQFMDNVMYWRLIHRSEEDLKSIFNDSPFGDQVEIISEEHSVNLFAVATKPN